MRRCCHVERQDGPTPRPAAAADECHQVALATYRRTMIGRPRLPPPEAADGAARIGALAAILRRHMERSDGTP